MFSKNHMEHLIAQGADEGTSDDVSTPVDGGAPEVTEGETPAMGSDDSSSDTDGDTDGQGEETPAEVPAETETPTEGGDETPTETPAETPTEGGSDETPAM